jgi:hypothetical protein
MIKRVSGFGLLLSALLFLASCQSAPSIFSTVLTGPCPTSLSDELSFQDSDDFVNRLRCELGESADTGAKKVTVNFDTPTDAIPERLDAFVRRSASEGGQIKTCEAAPEQSAGALYEVLTVLGQQGLQMVKDNATYSSANRFNVRMTTSASEKKLIRVEFIEKDGSPVGC